MSDLLSKLRTAHDQRVMRSVEVPEYGITLYFPPLTLADREKISRGINPRDEIALSVSALIHQAKDADGSPAFPDKPATRAELYRIEVDVLQRIMAQAQGGLGSQDAAEVAGADLDVLRPVIIAALDEQPKLSAAVGTIDDAVLRRVLSDILSAADAGKTTKNA